MANNFYVAGPSVRPDFGSPDQFIKGLADTANRFRTNRQKDDELENIKLFREQTQNLNERKFAFDEAAPERARAEALFQREQANQRAKEQVAAVNGAGGSRIDPFLARPETQTYFKENNVNDPAEQRKIVEALYAENRALFSDYKVAGQTAFENIIAGGGSLAEAETARTATQKQIFKTPLSDDLAGKLILKPDTGVSSSKLFGSGSGSINGTTATSPLQGIPNQINSEELQKLLNDKLGVEGNRFSLFGWRPTDNEFLGGAHDLEQSDVTYLQGQFGQELRPETIQRVLLAVGDPQDGTVKFNPKKMSETEKEDFLLLGQQLEIKANEGRASTGPLAGLTVQDIQKLEQDRFRQIADFNTGIVNQTFIQNSTFEDRYNALRKALGQPNGAAAATVNARQGGNEGSNAQVAPPVVPQVPPPVAPPVVPPAGSSGSAGLDQLLAPPESQAKIVINNNTDPKTSIFSKEDKVDLSAAKAELKSLESRSNVGSVERRRAELIRIIDKLEANEALKGQSDKLFKETGGTMRLTAQEKPGGATKLFSSITNALR